MLLKKIILTTGLLITFASTAIADSVEYKNELNRRNFVSLNVDASSINLTVYYPTSTITQVCGVQLRTNISHFSNSHMESLIAGIEVVEDNGASGGITLQALQHVSEPPYYTLTSSPVEPEIKIRIKTRGGETLRQLITNTADPKNAAVISAPPEIVAVAKHCNDASN